MPQDPNAARLSYVLGKNPELAAQPATATAMAFSGSSDNDIATMSGYLRGKKIAEALKGIPSDAQYNYWQSMSQADKNMATASGYLLPLDAHEPGGPNALEKGVGKVFGFLGKFTPNAAEKPLKAGLHAYTDFVENTVQRGFRAYDLSMQQGEGTIPILGDIKPLNAIGGIFTGDMKRWWDEADKDNAPVDPGVEGRVRERFGDSLVSLIRIEQQNPGALGQKFQDLIGQGDTEQAGRLDETMRSPEFKEAFGQMENARLSFGRLIPQLLHLEDNEKMFNILSGPLDGAWRLATDPLNQAIPAAKGFREAPYVVPKFDDAAAKAKIEDAFTGTDKASVNVQRYHDQAGAHMETIRSNPGSVEAQNALRELKTNFKQTWPLHDQMMKYGVKDSATAKDFYTTELGYRHLLSGNKANPRGLLPYRTALGEKAKAIKPGSIVDFLEHGDDLTRDSIRQAAGQLEDAGQTIRKSDFAMVGANAGKGAQTEAFKAAQADQAAFVGNTGKALDDWRRSWRGRAATSFRRPTTPTVAVDRTNQLDLMADGATEQVHRLARYYGPKYWADQIAATFSATTDIVLRKNIVKGLMETMAEATGIVKSVEGRAWLDGFVKNMDDEVAGTYALGPVGKLASGERSAWLLEDARPYLPIPSFKEFHGQSAKVGLTQHIWGKANSDMVDNFMNTAWRPMMLLRPATAMRNAIDEVANLMLRNGAQSFVTGRAELRVANQKQFGARQAAKADAGSAADNAASLEAKLIDDFGSKQAFDGKLATAPKDEAKALRKREKELLDAQDKAQILHARFEGTKHSIDPTAGRLFRMYSNSAKAVAQRIPFAPQGMKDVLERAVSGDHLYDMYRAHLYGKLSDQWIKRFADPKDSAKMEFIDDLVNDDLIRARIGEDMIGSAKDSLSENTRMMDGIVRQPGKKGSYRWVQVDKPGRMSPADTAGARAWNQRLNKMADDEVAVQAMLHIDNEAKAIRLMARSLRENPKYAAELRTARDKTPEEFAAQAFREVRDHLSDSNGNLNRSIVDNMVEKVDGVRTLNRDAFSPEVLNDLPIAARPDKIIGRGGVLVQESGNRLYDMIQNSFTFFGEMTAYLSRHPQMVDEYLNMRVELSPWEQAQTKAMVDRGISESRAAEIAKGQAHAAAVEKGTERVLQYVDHPEIRSQAAVIFRNLAPFYRAQEEFFRRWARTMKYSPEMFARANLYIDGANDSGMFFTDDQGTKYFVYPGTDVLRKGMVEVGQKLGIPMAILPVPVPMTGQVNMLAPGFQTEQWSKVFNGPILTMPTGVAETLTGNPTLLEFQRKAFGDVAAGQNPLMNVVPSIIRPVVDAAINRKELMFAASKQAIAYLQANGQGLPDNPSPEQRQAFLERVKRHALGVVVTKALLAPNLPAAPRAGSSSAPSTDLADPASQAEGMRYITDRFHKLVEQVGYEEAYGYWVKEHPDELPFMVGSTEGESKAYLPMTTRAYDFISQNRDVMTRYKKAGGFLVPQEPGDTDMKAWQLAMDLGIRKFKDVNSYVDDVIISNDLSFYYDQKDVYETQLAQAKDSGGVTASGAVRNTWQEWKDHWMPFHPLVQAEIADGSIRQQQRKETLDELGQMLNDPEVPQTPSLGKMRSLVDGYNVLQAQQAQFPGRDDASTARRKALGESFQAWAKKITTNDPGSDMLYQRIFRYLD